MYTVYYQTYIVITAWNSFSHFIQVYSLFVLHVRVIRSINVEYCTMYILRWVLNLGTFWLNKGGHRKMI